MREGGQGFRQVSARTRLRPCSGRDLPPFPRFSKQNNACAGATDSRGSPKIEAHHLAQPKNTLTEFLASLPHVLGCQTTRSSPIIIVANFYTHHFARSPPYCLVRRNHNRTRQTSGGRGTR
jgi:hypothetical protein